MRILVIGYVWPETNASAASVRTWNELQAFAQAGWETHFWTTAKPNEFTARVEALGARTASIALNDPEFDRRIAELAPDVAILDRFLTEEQFGWRIREHSPTTARVLDTQDLHFLRRAREAALKAGKPLTTIFAAQIDLLTEDALRELAAIHRSDATLIVSDFEERLLRERFHVPADQLRVFRLLDPVREESPPDFAARRDFVMIGNFRHPPNADGVRWIRREIWPLIRQALPRARVDIYGAYPPREFMNMTDPENGFHVQGPADHPGKTLRTYRINLAPLRFGAGIKGKILDGWACGTPCVSTPIGSEGMEDGASWGGAIAGTPGEFAERAVTLYQDEKNWNIAQSNGTRILNSLFDRQKEQPSLLQELTKLCEELPARRASNVTGAILWHQTLRSTEYFSRWIEARERIF